MVDAHIRRIGSTTMTSTPEPGRSPARPSRRAVLAGAGGMLLLAACGKTTSSSGSSAATTGSSPAAGTLNLAPRFDVNEYLVAGSPQRMVFSVLDNSGVTPKDLPRTVAFSATRNGTPVGAPVTVAAHDDGVPIPYFPVPFTFDQAGTYELTAALPGTPSGVPVKVAAAGSLALVGVGQPMKPVDTPTVTDAHGVDPICTRAAGTCALHQVTLRDALATGKPTALLVSTPLYCQIGICGPVLDLLLGLRDGYPDIQFIHAEVYKAPGATKGDPVAGGLAPVMDAYGLLYEPALYLAGADGMVRTRLDNVFDRTEMRAGLDGLR